MYIERDRQAILPFRKRLNSVLSSRSILILYEIIAPITIIKLHKLILHHNEWMKYAQVHEITHSNHLHFKIVQLKHRTFMLRAMITYVIAYFEAFVTLVNEARYMYMHTCVERVANECLIIYGPSILSGNNYDSVFHFLDCFILSFENFEKMTVWTKLFIVKDSITFDLSNDEDWHEIILTFIQLNNANIWNIMREKWSNGWNEKLNGKWMKYNLPLFL